MEIFFVLALIVALAALAVRRFYTRTLFELEIQKAGRVRVVKGSPPPGYRDACEDVARLHRLTAGRIRAVAKAGQEGLRFSDEIPEPARQAFRNVWNPPPSPGGGGFRGAR